LLAYNFWLMNCTCWVKYAKGRIRWVILSLTNVDKWWAYVDDLFRHWIWLLCYVSNVIAWGVWNGGQYSCDVNILGGMGMYMCYAWDPWMFMIIYVWLWLMWS